MTIGPVTIGDPVGAETPPPPRLFPLAPIPGELLPNEAAPEMTAGGVSAPPDDNDGGDVSSPKGRPTPVEKTDSP